MADVLLLGGTGAIGGALLTELQSYNHNLFVTSRSRNNTTAGSFKILNGNAKDLTFLETIISEKKFDAIIDFMVYETEEFRHRLHKLLSSTSHYFFLSSARVFADTGGSPITEKSPRLLDTCLDKTYLESDEYALAKARQENLLRSSNFTNWTIVRPYITYSTYRFQLGTLEANTLGYRALQNLPVITSKEILSKSTTLTWAGDVAKMMGKILLDEKSKSEDYNLVTSEFVSWNEVAAIYENTLLLKLIEVDHRTYEKAVGGIYQIRYDRMLHRRFNNEKTLRFTGLNQSDFKSIRKGLSEELKKFKESPFVQYANISLNAKIDRVVNTSIDTSKFTLQEKIEYFSEKYPEAKILIQIARKCKAKLKRCF